MRLPLCAGLSRRAHGSCRSQRHIEQKRFASTEAIDSRSLPLVQLSGKPTSTARDVIPFALSQALASLKDVPTVKVYRNQKLLRSLRRRTTRKPFVKIRFKTRILRPPPRRKPIQIKPEEKLDDRPIIRINLTPEKLQDVPPEYNHVARLNHGLETVLRTPRRIHWYNDPATHKPQFGIASTVANDLPQPDDMKMDELNKFTKPSVDLRLRALAHRSRALFCGSTSSLTRVLLHLWRMHRRTDRLNTLHLSDAFPKKADMSESSLVPPTLKLTFRHGTWFTDSESSFDPTEGTNELLSQMGHIGEKLLTASNEDFAAFRNEANTTLPDLPLAYAYSRYGNLLMRSQIDCYDERLPRKTFDVKFRATISLRLDRLNYEEGRFYDIKSVVGPFESFEREMYDLYRNAFLKYSLQARIGNMDGIMIAFHNTRKLFGFQYWPLEEMDAIYSSGHENANQLYLKSLGSFEAILENVMPEGADGLVVYLTLEYRKKEKEIHVYSKAGRSDIVLHRFQIAGKDAKHSVSLYHTQTTGEEANQMFSACRTRQLQFTNVFAPSGLSEEERIMVREHNQAQAQTQNSRGRRKASGATSDFASKLIRGVTYNLEPWPFVHKIREMSRANRELEERRAS